MLSPQNVGRPSALIRSMLSSSHRVCVELRNPQRAPQSFLHFKKILESKNKYVPSLARNFFGNPFSPEKTVHQERRLVKYTPEELFDVVSAVQHYSIFLPWCEQSVVLGVSRDNQLMKADLKIGFRGLSEKYTSSILLSRPRSITVEAIDSMVFKELKSHWTFQTGPTPGSCWLEFKVEFCFRSPLYNQVASMFLDEVVKKMMTSFEQRCRQLYGERSGSGGVAYT